MKYRELKRCNNIKVSEIALGCEGFMKKSKDDYKTMINRAIELGINFIDMYTSNPDFRDLQDLRLWLFMAGCHSVNLLSGGIEEVSKQDYIGK